MKPLPLALAFIAGLSLGLGLRSPHGPLLPLACVGVVWLAALWTFLVNKK